jgi:hypothetical protein
MNFELKDPDDEGKWFFQFTDTIAVSFDRDDSGNVNLMKMYQGGYTFELPREGAAAPADLSREEAREYLGKYHFAELGADAEVLYRSGRLAIDIPGEMVYDLRLPNDDGRWIFRVKDAISIEFNRDEAGTIESLTLRNSNQGPFTLPRVAGGQAEQTITLEDVMAKHLTAVGNDRLKDIKTLRMAGTIDFVNQGLKGNVEILARGMTHYRNHIDLGRSGTIDVIVAGGRGWSASSFDPTEELEGKYLTSVQRQHPLMMAADWRDIADRVTLGDMRTINDRPHYIVNVKLDDMIDSEIAIDAETGLVTGENITIVVRNLGSVPMKLRYDDYRDVEGLMLPSKMTAETGFHGDAVMVFNTIEVNVEVPADTFAAPASAPGSATP